MGKAGRFACIFTPMALTIASLVCLVLVGLGGTNSGNDYFNSLYFFRANASDINIDPKLINLPSNAVTDKLVDGATETVKNALDVKDIYHVHLWNYCDGDIVNNGTDKATSDKITKCSSHETYFWFNPVDVWGLNNTKIDQVFSKELRAGLKAYQKASKWMSICYIVALIATVVEILVGFLALFSRIGSLVTTIVSCVSSVAIIGFALTATILYSTLAGTFNTALNKYNVKGSLGKNIYVATWLGVAFSFGAGLFWLLSSCCCSGRSDKIKGYGDNKGKGEAYGAASGGNRFFGQKPYNYQRMGSPEGGMPYNNAHGGSHPMQNFGGDQRPTAYEPFRHDRGGMA